MGGAKKVKCSNQEVEVSDISNKYYFDLGMHTKMHGCQRGLGVGGTF